MKLNVWMLCLAGCLAVASTCDAQGRGGRGGGMGGGGFGGIFSLTGNESVQKELALTSDEITKTKEISDDYNAANREGMTGLNLFGPNATPEDRTKADAVRKANNEKFIPKLKAALSADQFTRLQQINWQNQGSRALSDPEVVKALTVTKDQQDKIKTLGDEYDVKAREAFTPGSPPDFAKMGEINKERDAKVTEVLTKDQQDKFASLKGKEFDVAQLRGGRGGRGNRGGGGGNGGGGGGGTGKRPQPKAE